MSDNKMLRELALIGNRFRATPIVDDDFPAIRNEFDATLEKASRFAMRERPKFVCLCGSTRFLEEFRKAEFTFTLEGKIVLTIGCDSKSDSELFKGPDAAEIKKNLDALHFRKIEMADEVFIINVGGYIGESTRNEIDHAKKIGVPITYLV